MNKIIRRLVPVLIMVLVISTNLIEDKDINDVGLGNKPIYSCFK